MALLCPDTVVQVALLTYFQAQEGKMSVKAFLSFPEAAPKFPKMPPSHTTTRWCLSWQVV